MTELKEALRRLTNAKAAHGRAVSAANDAKAALKAAELEADAAKANLESIQGEVVPQLIEAGHPMSGFDLLEGAALQGLQAPGVDFSDTALRKVDFREANLVDANFAGADLRGANFEDANVAGANFTDADLRGAKFDGANVRGACFKCADLERASFDLADISKAVFRGANLTRAGVISAAEMEDADFRWTSVHRGFRSLLRKAGARLE